MGRTSDARDRLLDATIDLVWQSSYGAVSVDAICDQAGVKKGSFYHFFESKDALVIAALDEHWKRRRPVFDAIFSASQPPIERLRRYLAHSYTRQNEIREQYGRVLGCFHNSVAAECIKQPEDVAAKVQALIDDLRSYLVTAIRDAQAEGAIPKGDPVALAKVLFAYVQGALLQARIYDDPELLLDLPRNGLALLGIEAPTTKKPPKAAVRRAPKTARV